jgi:hypothetical protein
MTENYPDFEDAEEGEFVGPNTIKSGEDSIEMPMNRTRIHSNTDNSMIQYLHRTANDYDLDHSDAAEIYNEVSAFLADTHRLDQEQFESDINQALEEYSDGAEAEEVVEKHGLDEAPKEDYAELEEIREDFS